MPNNRILQHPILAIKDQEAIQFFWRGKQYSGVKNETIAAALIANGFHIFGYHPKDNAPMGIYCANGQCSQCMVVANGFPVKACVEKLIDKMVIEPMEGIPELKTISTVSQFKNIQEIEIPVLIIGGGPAGLSCGIELGNAGINSLLIDDKPELGGKLTLQTHRFFGSSKAAYASKRGINIAKILSGKIMEYPSVNIWLNSTCLAVFSDKKIGILKEKREFILVKPEQLLIACGAREKFLPFQGNTLPGIMGAGAFQTLVNINHVLPAKKLFIIGGGNVGLIAGYHALQAGIDVVGLIEVLPECGGYKVHKDKLHRLGVPILTSHTILSANGSNHVESVTIARVNQDFKLIPGSESTIPCDCILVAVGLDPINEFFDKANQFGIPVLKAGDSDEISEASAAIFSGKIKGLELISKLKQQHLKVPTDWIQQKAILSSKPGSTFPESTPQKRSGVYPVLHCTQEIPCDPCTHLCPLSLINIDASDIRKLPTFQEAPEMCTGCANCVIGCPGLAITLVDYRSDKNLPTVSIPCEFNYENLKVGEKVALIDTEGEFVVNSTVKEIVQRKGFQFTRLIKVDVDAKNAEKVAGFRLRTSQSINELYFPAQSINNATIVCRCERVSAGEIRDLIHKGYRDLNEIKTITRAGMGSCGGKTCQALIMQIMKQEGVPLNSVTLQTTRPLFIEVPFKYFAGVSSKKESNNG